MLATAVDHRRNGYLMPKHERNSATDGGVQAGAGGASDRPDHDRTPSRRGAVLRAVGLIGVVLVWLVIAGLGGPAVGSL